MGTVIDVSQDEDMFDAYNIWSGCVVEIDAETVLALYTGLRLSDEPLEGSRKYACQSIGMALSGDRGVSFDKRKEPLICPVRDYDKLKDLGYYLGPVETLGRIDDPDGTFMCLRDPEVFMAGDEMHVIFGCKVRGDNEGNVSVLNGVGHGVFRSSTNLEDFEIQPPLFASGGNGL